MQRANHTQRNHNTSYIHVINNNNLYKKTVHYMLVIFSGLAMAYMVILVNMVWNIVERKTLEADARNLSNTVAELELNYLKLAGQVDVTMSQKMGFLELKPAFAKSTSSKSLGVVAKANNEI